MTDPRPSRAFQAAVGPTVDDLQRLCDAYSAATTPGPRLPAADAPAMAEIARQLTFMNAAWPQPVDNTHSTASVITFAGVDHLRSFARLIRNQPTPVFAHLLVARAGLLAFAAAAWLCEPGLDVATRVKRYLVLELEDAQNLKRYGLQQMKNAGKARVQAVRDGAAHRGWEVVCNRQTRMVDQETYPATANAIAMAIGPHSPPAEREIGAVVWSYLSGISHGYTFALMQSARTIDTPSAVPGLTNAAFGVNSDSVNVMAFAIAAAAITACERHLLLMGWVTPEWEAAVAAVAARFARFAQAAGPRITGQCSTP